MAEYRSKWIVFNQKGKRLKTVTLKHKNGALYREIEPFEKELIQQGLYAHRAECFDQEFLKGKPFKEKLQYLGWVFNSAGFIQT
jgi:hypothetical protein